MRSAYALVSMAMLFVAGCGASATTAFEGSDEHVPVPESTGVVGDEALLSGVLRGSSDPPCLWLEGDDGSLSAIRWPQGYTMTVDSLQLYDEQGRLVARDGDRIDLPGSGATTDELEQCRVSEFVWSTSGPPAVTPAPAASDRLAGADRIATAIAVAQRQFPAGAPQAYLVASDAVSDALAGGVLTDGPLLLVPRCGPLPSAVVTELRRLRPRTVVALGGQVALADHILEQARLFAVDPEAHC